MFRYYILSIVYYILHTIHITYGETYNICYKSIHLHKHIKNFILRLTNKLKFNGFKYS